jgi:hypothetical protein
MVVPFFLIKIDVLSVAIWQQRTDREGVVVAMVRIFLIASGMPSGQGKWGMLTI